MAKLRAGPGRQRPALGSAPARGRRRGDELQAVSARRGHRGPRRDLHRGRGVGEEPPRPRLLRRPPLDHQAARAATPIFREYLGRGGLQVLESGCGSGRWMAFFEKLGNQAFGVDDSWGPLLLAREHDPDMRLVRGNALAHALRRQHLRRRVLVLRRRALRGRPRGAVPRDPPRAQARAACSSSSCPSTTPSAASS